MYIYILLLVTILHATNRNSRHLPSETNLLFISILDPSKFLGSKKGVVVDRCIGHLARVSVVEKGSASGKGLYFGTIM
jgi:hypothetical protein